MTFEIRQGPRQTTTHWIPAFAGMTEGAGGNDGGADGRNDGGRGGMTGRRDAAEDNPLHATSSYIMSALAAGRFRGRLLKLT